MSESKILRRLREIADSDDGRCAGTTMGNGPHPWIWIRNGEFSGGDRLDMTDEETSREIAGLVSEGKVLLCICKDELCLELPKAVPEQVHILTTKQLRKVVNAIGGDKDWPKATNDPKVNHVVDCIVADEGEEPKYDEELYTAEAKVFKTLMT